MRKTDLLRQLQDADSRRDAARTTIEQIEAQLGQREALAVREAELAALRAELHQIETQQRDLDLQAEDRRTKIAGDEAKLYGGKVTNPKELTSLTEEVAQDKRQLSDVEDKLLAILDQVDDLNGRIAAQDAALQKDTAAWEAEQSGARAKLAAAQADVSGLEAKRTQIAAQVAPHDLSTYETIRRQKGGTAVAAVQQRTCQSCRVGLTPSQEQRARIGADLILCHSCGRILFVALT